MADDDTKQEENLEEEVVDQTQEDAQEELQEEAQETKQAEDEQEKEETEEETQQEETQEEQAPPSRREQLRIQQLLNKYPNLQDRVEPQQQQVGINYKDMIEADEQTFEQLNRASQDFGNSRYQQGEQTAKFYSWKTDLKIDTPQVYKDHPELDPKNEDAFKPALADTFNRMYLSTVGYDGKSVKNPDLGYRDYIDSMYELVDEAASRKVERTQANITKQAARTGLRPDGSSAKRLDLTKAPEAMTDEELDAAMSNIGLAPKKR